VTAWAVNNYTKSSQTWKKKKNFKKNRQRFTDGKFRHKILHYWRNNPSQSVDEFTDGIIHHKVWTKLKKVAIQALDNALSVLMVSNWKYWKLNLEPSFSFLHSLFFYLWVLFILYSINTMLKVRNKKERRYSAWVEKRCMAAAHMKWK
jgi:hypothetical protein